MSAGFTKTDKQITRAILARLGQAALAVYSVLKCYEWDGDREGWPTVSEIAEEVGLKERATQIAIADLEKDGFITREVSLGRGKRPSYTIKGASEIPFSLAPYSAKRCIKRTLLAGKGASDATFSAEKVHVDAPLHIEERAEERQRQESKRQEEREPARPCPPSLEKFLAHAKMTGADPVSAERCWNNYEIKGWPNGGAKWDLVLRSWILGDVQRKLDAIPARNGPAPHKETPQEKALRFERQRQEAKNRGSP